MIDEETCRQRPPPYAPIAAQQAAVGRRQATGALLLVAPLFLLTLLLFVVPLLSVLFYAVDDREVGRILPRTTASLANWDGEALPPEGAFSALRDDLRFSHAGQIPHAALRLNYEVSGFRSLLMGTARRIHDLGGPSVKNSMIEFDGRWGEIGYWRAIRSARGPLTARYILAALDLRQEWDGSFILAQEDERIYVNFLARTLWMSFVVLVVCVTIGFPIAYLIANSPPSRARILFYIVLLPFWTSLLVRTAAWVVLLQREGVVNDALLWLGVINHPVQLIFNRFGVYVAMVHLLAPFMILPLYSVMRGIPADHMRAAASLGARPLPALLTIYLPQTLPGLGAGCLLVYVLALGFYITPALVGGAGDQMLAYLIAEFALGTANWGMAAALAIILLICVALLYPIYRRHVGIERLSLG